MNHRSFNRFPILGIIAVITAIAAIPFLNPIVRGEVFTFRDHSDYFQPMRFFTAEYLRVLRLPLWNPYSASGEPWLANPQTGVFYPPAWIFLILPFSTAYMLYLLFHLALLGCAGWLLFRRFAGSSAALFGSVALMFSGPTLSMLDVQNNLATMGWSLLALGSALDLRAGHGSARVTAVWLALSFFAGEPFLALLGAMAVAVIAAKPVRVATAGAAAAGLTAVQLVPLLEHLRASDRREGLHAAEILRDSMRVRDWLRIAIPPRLTDNAFDPALSQHYVPVIYLGVTVVALSIFGAATLLRERRYRFLAVVGAAVLFAMAVASGPSLLARMPVTLFRYPARVVPIAAVAFVCLAVVGWDRIRRSRWIDALLIAVCGAELLAAGWPLLAHAPHQIPQAALPLVGRSAKMLRLADDPRRIGLHRETWLAGYLNLYEKRFDAWTAAPLTNARYAARFEEALADPRKAVALSVGWVMAAQPLRYPRFQPAARTSHVVIYRDPHPLPFAYLSVPDGVVPARFLAFGPSHVHLNITAPQDGVVVVTQNDAPGWRVRVDGVEQRKELASGTFRAVRIPRGDHQVHWWYQPPSLFAGAAVTAITLLALLISGGWSRKQRSSADDDERAVNDREPRAAD